MRAVVLLVAPLLLAAGCGGESSSAAGTTISTEEYVTRADQLCARVASDVSELGGVAALEEIQSGSGSDTEKMEQAADLFERQLELVSQFREDLEALGTPSGAGEEAEAFVEQIGSAEDELDRAIDALREGDDDEAGEALRRYAQISLESASSASESDLDFEVCGGGA